ncbi:YbaN family protein [Phocaeicola barnesiae]|uniref:YbaN family protein n=1 Tax=Phocaeicola barnesiae TaxID=376804 RepID=UPI000382791D|nr:YbaN family protein [Phocaeicola barnesiae]
MKYIYLFIGFLSLILGVIGIFLPVLPTTPFLLLSAALFFRSSPRAYDWLLAHKYLGPYIRSFREDRMIPLRAKIVSISLLWLTALHCAVLLFESWWLRIGMVVMAICVTAYILSFKTRPSAK